jgi:hypothetical protein
MQYFACEHPDPEKVIGLCPRCGDKLTLGHGDLEAAIAHLCLGPSEVPDLKVTEYVGAKHDE